MTSPWLDEKRFGSTICRTHLRKIRAQVSGWTDVEEDYWSGALMGCPPDNPCWQPIPLWTFLECEIWLRGKREDFPYAPDYEWPVEST